jgi:hypothetical protein
VDADDPQPAGDLAVARRRDVALGLFDADELYRERLPAQQEQDVEFPGFGGQ